MAQTDNIEALLAAARRAEEMCWRCSRRAARLDGISYALYIVAAIIFGVSLADYLLLHAVYMTLLVAGLAAWWAAAAARILYHVYDSKATKAARQACVYRRVAEVIAEIRKIRLKLEATRPSVTAGTDGSS